ncbi:MAG: hypothetical protein V1646_02010 [bacterium]
MKILNYIFVASLVFALISTPMLAQEVEPELEQFLADNPDLLSAQPNNKQDKPANLQLIADQTNTGELDHVEAEKTEADTKLNAITEAFNSIFEDYLFLNQASSSTQQTELYNLKLFIDNEIANKRGGITINGSFTRFDYASWYAQRLSEIIYWFKFACLNLETLSVSTEDAKFSALQEPLDFVEMQQAKLKIFGSLLDMYQPSLKKGQVPLAWTEYTEKSVRSIIFRSLPNRLQSSVISYILCGITQSSKQAYYLSKILSQNFYAEKVVLSEEYFEIASTFYKAQKFGESLDIDAFLNKIEEVINGFAASRTSMQTSSKNIECNLVLELLLTKLIKIKNDVVKFYKPNLNFKDNQEKAKLLIRYKLFLESKKFELLFSNRQFCTFFDLYCNFLQDFFANKLQSQAADLRLFEVECMLENLLKDKQISWLMQQLYKKDPGIAVLDDMKNILESIRIVINKDLKISAKGFFAGIKDAIFSGNWIDTGKVKGIGTGSSQSIVDFMEYAFDRKFENFKEAAFFLLAKTSPVLAAGLIYKVMPYLSGNLQEKASKLIGGPELGESGQSVTDSAESKLSENAISRDGNKIFDFISKNPEIFNKLCEVKPELINGLADIVERKLAKENV